MVLENNIYKEKKMKLKLLDLFSGIGGFSLGLESTGFFETIAFVEKDKFCQKVLKKNFNNIPIEEDIRNVKGSNYKADVITGGFPCQPFSVAGKRKGTDDDRYLWDETIRVIRECKPRWFIGENVEGIINIQDGMVLRQVCTDLEEEGFEVQCLIIPASSIGAWHQRKRVWILAYSKHNGSHRSKGNETIKSSNEQEKRLSVRDDQDVSNTNSRLSVRENEEVQARGNTSTTSGEDVPNSERNKHKHTSIRESGTNKIWKFYSKKEKQATHDIWSKTTGCDAPLRQDTWWEAQSAFCGVPNGLSYELDKDRANRIKSLGNSIVALIARELGLAIIKAEEDV